MRTRIEQLPETAEDDEEVSTRRLNLASVALLVLALVCAGATVAFGFWMTTWAQQLGG